MRGLTIKLAALIALGGIFSYLVLPGLIENQLAQRLQEALGTPTKPNVEVSSSFPPELLLGRIDRIRVRMDQISVQGAALYNVRADLRIETQRCSLSVEAPPVSIDQNQACLSYLGLGGPL
jgi:hypothetical protein